MPWTVIPAKAGIQIFRMLLDPRFRGGDDGDQFFNGLLSHPSVGSQSLLEGGSQSKRNRVEEC